MQSAVKDVRPLLWQGEHLLGSGIFCVALPYVSTATVTVPPLFGWYWFCPWPHPPVSGSCSLVAGANLKWHGERVQRGSVPLHQRDHLIIHLPPFIFSQDFILAKSGLIRAAFTKLLPHFSQRGVKSYLQPPHNTIIYHKSSCCIYPTPHPLEALRAWDQVRMPLWVLLPPCGCPFKKEATLCIWFLSLPLAPPTLVQKPTFLAVVLMGRCAPGIALMGAFSLSVSGHIP